MSTFETMQLEVGGVMYYGACIAAVNPIHRPDLYGWVIAQFGRGRGDLTTAPMWFAHEDYFWFRYEQDRTLFILRWS